MSGVVYLHGLKIVHADLKGVRTIPLRFFPAPRQVKQANILVNNAGVALVSDLGLMSMTDLSTFLSESICSSGGTYHWTSPELLDPKRFCSNGRPTRQSDRYSLGMVIYEVSQLRSSRQPLVHHVLGSDGP